MEKGLRSMLAMLERFIQAPPALHPQGKKGTGYGTDCYHILSQALHLKGFAIVVRKSSGRVWASSCV